MAETHRKINNIELLGFGWIKQQIKKKVINIIIPTAIIYLIIKYFQRCFVNSKILSITQDWDLTQLMHTKSINPKSYSLSFRASEHDYSPAAFHKICGKEENSPNVVIIQSESGIFGGYTSRSWKPIGFVVDPTAFVFVIKSDKDDVQSNVPWCFDLKDKTQPAILCGNVWGPSFGDSDIILGDEFVEGPLTWTNGHKFVKANSSGLQTYYNDKYSQVGLCGGDYTMQTCQLFELIEYEVFMLK